MPRVYEDVKILEKEKPHAGLRAVVAVMFLHHQGTIMKIVFPINMSEVPWPRLS